MTIQLLQRPGKLALTISLLLPLLVGCTTTQAVDQPVYRSSATQASFSEAQLDSLLAPIALYPDTVLSHVLIASTYPLEVVEADRWARNNPRYKGDDAVNAVDNQDWDPSVKALVAFPEVLQRMSDDLDWTQQLGDAFLADEERVMDSIQTLRNRAYASGNLDKVEHVRVIREQKTIVIEPSVERVIYVPAYDTRVVYGNWWWADYPPVYWHYPSSYVFVSGFYWGPRVSIGPRFYFSACHWHQRRVVVVDHHHHNRFYNSRSVVRHSDARRWHHNPVHRRGVAYRDNPTRERYHSPRESYRDAREYRSNLRDNNQIAPNRARDQRQGRDEQFQQRLERRQAGQINNTTRPQAQRDEQRAQPRADLLRERINNRTGLQGNRTEQRDSRIEQRDNRTHTRDNRAENRDNRIENRDNRGENRAARIDQRNERVEQRGTGFEQREQRLQPQLNRVERTETPRAPAAVERIERTQRAERPQTERVNPIERREAPRVERTRNTNDNRASMRGERER